MAPRGAAYNVDWIYSNNSNVHIANHKDWFTTFTDFKSKTGTIYMGPNSGPEVLGVGNVELQVRTHRSPSGSRIILLRDVLYCPTAATNILGNPILEEFDVRMGPPPNGSKLVDKATRGNAGILDSNRLKRLRLAGHRADQTSLDTDTLYMINATWSDEERARWEQHKARARAQTQPQPSASLPPLTAEEKAWLKKHYGNEFKFLLAHGYKITDDEQRAKGREILRATMAIDSSDEEEEEDNSFLADLERDPASHVADYHFGEVELDWVEKHYRHTGNFMRSYGLKPWDDEDCAEGVQIAKTMMLSGG